MSEWQPIETAPKDGEPVLLYGLYWSDSQGPLSTAMMGRYSEGSALWEACWFHQYPFSIRPTHWMPLPSPPALSNEKEKG